MIATIAWRELRSLLLSPLGWTALALVQLVQGLIFYRLVQTYQAAPVVEGANAGITYNVAALLLGSTGYVALLLVPLLTMHLISGERRRRTLPLLMTAPVSAHQIILGKYVGIAAYLVLMLALVALMPVFLLTGTSLDLGLLLSAWFGTLLLLWTYAALGLLMSALAPRPAAAAVSAIAVLLLWWLLQMLAATGIAPLDRLLAYVSLFAHYEPMLRGMVDSGDLAYFGILIGALLGLSIVRLDHLRTRS